MITEKTDKMNKNIKVKEKKQLKYLDKLTAHKYVHPPNDADIEMEISKLKKTEKQLDVIK
jgi:hypothetical protein